MKGEGKMYQKQDTNDFIAFKSLFNQELQKAINNDDIEQIQYILKTTYDYETNNHFYDNVPIDLTVIKNLYNEFSNELEKEQFLMYKL